MTGAGGGGRLGVKRPKISINHASPGALKTQDPFRQWQVKSGRVRDSKMSQGESQVVEQFGAHALAKLSWTPASFPSHSVAPPHSISESGLLPAPSVRVQGRGHRQHLGVPGCTLSCESVFPHWLLSCLVTSFKLLLWGSSNTWPCCIPTYFFGSVPNQCWFCFCRPQSRCWDSTCWAWSDSVPAPRTLTLDIEHVSISWLIYESMALKIVTVANSSLLSPHWLVTVTVHRGYSIHITEFN